MSDVSGNGRFGRLLGLGLALAVAATLSACALNPFGSSHKSSGPKPKIEGQRVSVLSFDTPIQADERLAATPVTLPAAAQKHRLGSGRRQRRAHGRQHRGPRQDQVPVAGEGRLGRRQRLAPHRRAHRGAGQTLRHGRPVRLSAYDAKTGKGLWRTQLAISIENPEVGFGGGAAPSDNGKLFVSTGFGDVFALSPDTGAIIWRSKTGDPFRNPPAAQNGASTSPPSTTRSTRSTKPTAKCCGRSTPSPKARTSLRDGTGRLGRRRRRALHLGRGSSRSSPDGAPDLERQLDAHRAPILDHHPQRHRRRAGHR